MYNGNTIKRFYTHTAFGDQTVECQRRIIQYSDQGKHNDTIPNGYIRNSVVRDGKTSEYQIRIN